GGGGWLWIEHDRQARRAETTTAVSLALGKAEQLRDAARAVPLTDVAEGEKALPLWKQALAEAEKAEGILAAGLADEETARRVNALLRELQTASAQAQKDTRMLAALDRAALGAGTLREGQFDYRSAAATYAQAFTDYGLDARSAPPEEVARRLQQCPPAMFEP